MLDSSELVESNELIRLWQGDISGNPLAAACKDCSAFSKARRISLTLTHRRPDDPEADPAPLLIWFSDIGVRPPKTSKSSRELEHPGKGDLGVSEVVEQSNKSAWLEPRDVEAEITRFRSKSPRCPISNTLSSVPAPVSIRLEGREGAVLFFLLSRILTPEPEWLSGTSEP